MRDTDKLTGEEVARMFGPLMSRLVETLGEKEAVRRFNEVAERLGLRVTVSVGDTLKS